MTSSAAQRRRTAYAAAAAAKQRRNKILAIIGFVIFLAIMAYEIPHTLKLLNHSTPAVTPTVHTTAPVHPTVIPKALRKGVGRDPFGSSALANDDPQVAPSPGGRDPFATPAVQAVQEATPSPAQPLPETIVIGTPTANGATVHGWIVILASIPTREGQASAEGFARSARRSGIGSVAVLNSSNRRPLRGGYWVVYTGPVQTVTAAERLSSSVHSSGYATAYVRELIEYR
jgi:hypothetical protein